MFLVINSLFVCFVVIVFSIFDFLSALMFLIPTASHVPDDD